MKAMVWIGRRVVDVCVVTVVLHLVHKASMVEGPKALMDGASLACLFGSQLCRRRA